MKILMDVQVSLKYEGTNISWVPTQTWRHNSLNGRLYGVNGKGLDETFKEDRVRQLLQLLVLWKILN